MNVRNPLRDLLAVRNLFSLVRLISKQDVIAVLASTK